MKTINGLKVHNGLATIENGVSVGASLRSSAGLSSSSGLMTSADGRTTVTYLVKCALPAGHSITKADQYGKQYTFQGQIGVAPEWETGAMGASSERWVSACMLAMVNTTGDHYPLWLVAQNSAISWGLDPSFPFQEGAFFGDIFTSPVRLLLWRPRPGREPKSPAAAASRARRPIPTRTARRACAFPPAPPPTIPTRTKA